MRIIEFPILTNQRPYPTLLTVKNTDTGKCISGVFPGHKWEEGDYIIGRMRNLTHGNRETNPYCGNWIVSMVLEQADSKGVFKNPEEKKNSHFVLMIEPVEIDLELELGIMNGTLNEKGEPITQGQTAIV